MKPLEDNVKEMGDGAEGNVFVIKKNEEGDWVLGDFGNDLSSFEERLGLSMDERDVVRQNKVELHNISQTDDGEDDLF